MTQIKEESGLPCGFDVTLKGMRKREQGKYRALYSRTTPYGGQQHGRDARPLVEELCPASLLDVGCGDNSFCCWANVAGIPAVGVDFAHPRADVNAAAHALPFADEAFEWLTAFDMLEHLLPDEVDDVLREFARVASRGWIFSICYRDSTTRVHGETLHPTVRSESWWIERLSRYIHVEQWNGYLWGMSLRQD